MLEITATNRVKLFTVLDLKPGVLFKTSDFSGVWIRIKEIHNEGIFAVNLLDGTFCANPEWDAQLVPNGTQLTYTAPI